MKPNQLKRKLLAGEQVFGLFCSIPAPASVELAAAAGFDFVIIDTEHVLLNPETLEHMLRTAEATGITPLVRIAHGDGSDEKEILRALDGGAQGIVAPCVESAEAMRRIVAACKYHPQGMRSLNGGRPGAFGKHSLAEYVVRANEETMVVPMIESLAGVGNIRAILDTPGIDFVLEGAADLSQSCGLPWKITAPAVQEALQQVQQACADTRVPYCAIPRADGDYAAWCGRGVKAFVLGDERGIAFRALQAKLKSMNLNEG